MLLFVLSVRGLNFATRVVGLSNELVGDGAAVRPKLAMAEAHRRKGWYRLAKQRQLHTPPAEPAAAPHRPAWKEEVSQFILLESGRLNCLGFFVVLKWNI